MTENSLHNTNFEVLELKRCRSETYSIAEAEIHVELVEAVHDPADVQGVPLGLDHADEPCDTVI